MSTLVQIMACCLMALSNYLTQFWLITSEVLWHLTEIYVRGNSKHIYLDFTEFLEFKDVKFKTAALSGRADELVKITIICQDSEPFSWLDTVILLSGNLITVPIISGWLLTGSYQLSQAHLLPLTGDGWYKIGMSLWLAGEADSCNEGMRFFTTDQEKKYWITVRFFMSDRTKALNKDIFRAQG